MFHRKNQYHSPVESDQELKNNPIVKQTVNNENVQAGDEAQENEAQSTFKQKQTKPLLGARKRYASDEESSEEQVQKNNAGLGSKRHKKDSASVISLSDFDDSVSSSDSESVSSVEEESDESASGHLQQQKKLSEDRSQLESSDSDQESSEVVQDASGGQNRLLMMMVRDMYQQGINDLDIFSLMTLIDKASWLYADAMSGESLNNPDTIQTALLLGSPQLMKQHLADGNQWPLIKNEDDSDSDDENLSEAFGAINSVLEEADIQDVEPKQLLSMLIKVSSVYGTGNIDEDMLKPDLLQKATLLSSATALRRYLDNEGQWPLRSEDSVDGSEDSYYSHSYGSEEDEDQEEEISEDVSTDKSESSAHPLGTSDITPAQLIAPQAANYAEDTMSLAGESEEYQSFSDHSDANS
jgi:hypothetical protein